MCIWKCPFCNIKLFKGFCHCFEIVLNFEQWQNIKQQKNKTEQPYLALTWAAHMASPLGGPAHQGHRCLQPLPTGRGVSTRARSPWPPPCLLPPFPALLATPGDVDEAPNRPPSPLVTLPLLPARSRARPNELVATIHCHRGHWPSLASSTSPEGPQRRPHHLRRAKLRWIPCIAGYLVFFYLGHPRSPSTIGSVQTVPGRAVRSRRLAVSPSSFPLFSRARARPLAPFPTAAESSSPPAMA